MAVLRALAALGLVMVGTAGVAGVAGADEASEQAARAAAYDRYRQPEKIMAALHLAPGLRVADIGAGGGYLTFRIADAVGAKGLVVATDIDDDALKVLRAKADGRANVVVRKVAPDDPGLEPGRFDLIVLAEVDQYLPDRATYLARLRAALAPRGRIAVTNRQRFRAPLVLAAGHAGYSVVGESTDLPAQFLLFLEVRP
jgi:predicted methyltransferase